MLGDSSVADDYPKRESEAEMAFNDREQRCSVDSDGSVTSNAAASAAGADLALSRRSRLAFVLVILTVLVLLLGIGLAGLAYLGLYRPVQLVEAQTVIIRPSTSFGYVARRLAARNLIPNATAFKVYGIITNRAERMKVGEYEVTSGMRPVDILDLLVSGRAKAYWVTIPEGKWASEIPSLLTAQWDVDETELHRVINETAHWQSTMSFLAGHSLEGYLFPDTYRFEKTATAEQMIATMLKRFQQTCVAAYQADPPTDGRSLHEVLVLASLVEGEARVPEERETIAGVYMNRLARGMLLQCDATVLYARQERLRRVLYRDLEVNSPYNTYRYPGLPPGPINNPGLASFTAALRPAQVPYLYYVARGDGSHVFSRTLAEHNAAIRRIRGK
jgi:UPF0755 protein